MRQSVTVQFFYRNKRYQNSWMEAIRPDEFEANVAFIQSVPKDGAFWIKYVFVSG